MSIKILSESSVMSNCKISMGSPSSHDILVVRYQDVFEALDDWARKEKREPKQTYIWVCSVCAAAAIAAYTLRCVLPQLCLNQHQMDALATADQLEIEFGARIERIGHILPFLVPDT